MRPFIVTYPMRLALTIAAVDTFLAALDAQKRCLSAFWTKIANLIDRQLKLGRRRNFRL